MQLVDLGISKKKLCKKTPFDSLASELTLCCRTLFNGSIPFADSTILFF
jgi:hypothetical protein